MKLPRRTSALRVSACLCSLLVVAGRAQVSNDTCATATLIGEGLISGDNLLAQNNMPVTYCGLESPYVKDVWYRFDATAKGQLAVTLTCAATDFEVGVFLYSNGCGSLSSLVCADNSCVLGTDTAYGMAVPSSPARFAVAGLQGTEPAGHFTLKVTVDRISQFVISAVRVGQGWSGFQGPLGSTDNFGEVAALGDFDGNGVVDVAVGAPGTDDFFSNSGAVWILLQSEDGLVLGTHKLSPVLDGLLGLIETGDALGASLDGLGDLDGDGILDLAVAAPSDDDGGTDAGAVWILFLAPDGSVRSFTKISALSGGFGGAVEPGDRFGVGLATIGDVDGDGVVDLAVGAEGDDDGGFNRGAVWILFLQADGTVKSWQKLSSLSGGFPGPLQAGDHLGVGVGAAGDIDADGVPDVAIGAPLAGSGNQGVFWTVLLEPDGTVKAAHPIGVPPGFQPSPPDPSVEYGAALCGMGDLNDDGVPDLAVGAPTVDHRGAPGQGAVFQVYLNADGTLQEQTLLTKLTLTSSSYFPGQRLGRSLAFPGDVDGDGHVDLLIGDSGPSTVDSFMTVFLDPTNAWTTLTEGSLAGASNYAPELRGEGGLQPGTPWSLELAIAARNSPAAFIAGFSTQFHPFKGGVLVPTADVVVAGLVTDVHGRLELHGLWPAGVPSGAQIWIQAWVVDSGGPAGLAASNAVLGTAP